MLACELVEGCGLQAGEAGGFVDVDQIVAAVVHLGCAPIDSTSVRWRSVGEYCRLLFANGFFYRSTSVRHSGTDRARLTACSRRHELAGRTLQGARTANR